MSELNRCIQAKKRIAKYRAHMSNTIYDTFFTSDINLFDKLIDKYMDDLEEQDMSCKFCDGYCSCPTGNPPCSFCTDHTECEICGQKVCVDKAEEIIDNKDGSKLLVCPDCLEAAE